MRSKFHYTDGQVLGLPVTQLCAIAEPADPGSDQ